MILDFHLKFSFDRNESEKKGRSGGKSDTYLELKLKNDEYML